MLKAMKLPIAPGGGVAVSVSGLVRDHKLGDMCIWFVG